LERANKQHNVVDRLGPQSGEQAARPSTVGVVVVGGGGGGRGGEMEQLNFCNIKKPVESSSACC